MFERKERDKYGRTVYHFSSEPFRTKVVAVRLPNTWVKANPGKGRYLVNDWQMPVWKDGVHVADEPGKHTYVHSLKAARELAASKIQ